MRILREINYLIYIYIKRERDSRKLGVFFLIIIFSYHEIILNTENLYPISPTTNIFLILLFLFHLPCFYFQLSSVHRLPLLSSLIFSFTPFFHLYSFLLFTRTLAVSQVFCPSYCQTQILYIIGSDRQSGINFYFLQFFFWLSFYFLTYFAW